MMAGRRRINRWPEEQGIFEREKRLHRAERQRLRRQAQQAERVNLNQGA